MNAVSRLLGLILVVGWAGSAAADVTYVCKPVKGSDKQMKKVLANYAAEILAKQGVRDIKLRLRTKLGAALTPNIRVPTAGIFVEVGLANGTLVIGNGFLLPNEMGPGEIPAGADPTCLVKMTVSGKFSGVKEQAGAAPVVYKNAVVASEVKIPGAWVIQE